MSLKAVSFTLAISAIITINGESYRLKDKRKAGLLPKPAKAKE